MSTVIDISHALSSILDLDILLQEIVITIQEKYKYLQVNVFTVHKGRGKIIFQAGTGERSQAYRDSYLTFDINNPDGILPWVAREGKTFLSNDVLREPQYRFPEILPSTARSELSIPLIAGGEVVGILDIQSDQVNSFDREDVYLFEALSAGIATSIRNATLYRSELFRRQVAESIRDIAGILSNGSSVDELMNRILEKLMSSLPSDAASIWLTTTSETNNFLLTLAASQGISTHLLKRTFQTRESTGQWIQDALVAEEPIIRKSSDPRGPLGEAMDLPDEYSAIAAPLRAGGETVGILTLAHRQPGRYGSEARLITQTFAGYAAVAIQNSRLYAAAREQAWVSTTLLKIAEANKTAQTLNDLSENTVRLIPELIGCSNCAFYYYNPPLNIYERKATSGFSSDALPARSLPKDQAALIFANKLSTPITAYYARGEFSLTSIRDVPAGLIVPLITRGQPLGMLWIGNSNDRSPFTERTIQVITGISHQTATAMENLQLLENQQQDAFIAAALLQVAQTVASQDNLQNILDTILNLLSILAGIESAAFFLKDQDHQSFQPVTSFLGLNSEALRSIGTRILPGDFPLLDLVTEQNIILLSPLINRHKSAINWTNVKQ
ncbi:MAG TPA: GAF domain-containing protein, partial [Leptolinea sp.]